MKNFIVFSFCLISLSLIAFYAQAQVTMQWSAMYNGQGDYNDRFTCSTTDPSGNIIMAGSTVNPDAGRDYLVVKLNASGVVQWSKQFGGSELLDDEVTAITTDASNNIYITGFAKNLITSQDYYTLKLNAAGDTLWTRTYDFAFEYDQANSIAVDAAGNVYVTGQSDRDSSFVINDDYATLKYSAAGNVVWVNRYNGAGNAIDRAVKLVLDATSNVYVTGRSSNGSDDDYVTIKYNSAGGTSWTKIEDRGGRDRPTSMTIDGSGNTYITGYSSNGNDNDFWTIKYNAAGTIVWQKVYNYLGNDEAYSIAVDASGNVIVTGSSEASAATVGNLDYLTVCYNSAGTQQWQKRYNGSGNNNDIANSIAINGTSVYITGKSDVDATANVSNNIATLSYAISNGAVNWTTVFAGAGGFSDEGICVLATGSGCYVGGFEEDANARRNALCLSYSTSGTQQWKQNFNGLGDNNDNIRGLCVDNNNTVYAAGYSVTKGENRDIAVVKFSASGAYVCEYIEHGTSTGGIDEAQAITVDNSGNPIVACFTKNSGQSNDLTWLGLSNSLCDTLWHKSKDGGFYGSDKIYDITQDAAGNRYITGRIDTDPSSLSNEDCYTAKINSAGSIVWEKTYNSGGLNDDRGLEIKVSSAGNVYVSGRSFNGTNYDIFLIKYNNAGAQQWLKIYNSGDDVPRSLAIDAAESIYITGYTTQVDTIHDIVTLKYDNAGNLTWAKKYNGTGNGNDEGEGITVDANGNVYVVGFTDSDATMNQNIDILLLKYTASGTLDWFKIYAGATGADDIGDAIAINASNQVFVTGHTNKGSVLQPNYNIISQIYDVAGNMLWSDMYNGPSDSSDIPNVVYIKGNDYYVGGSSVKTNEMRNMLIVKYSGILSGLSSIDLNTVSVGPNPFDNQLIINGITAPTMFKIFDQLGKLVFSTLLAPSTTQISITPLTQGLYYYQLIDKNGASSVGKLIKN
jgi:uncharacterized delta-60 repeat protein